MKRKLSSLILALLLVVTLISCDAAVSVMGAMGNNILGVDKSTLDSAVNSVTVSDENKTVTETITDEEKKVDDKTTLSSGKKLTYKTSDGEVKTLFTVGTTTNNQQVIVVDGETIPVSSDVNLEDIVSILPPQDLTEVANALGSSGKSKEEMVKALDKVISDENTKEATKGTATILKGLLGIIPTSSGSSSTRALTRDGESDSSDAGQKINAAFNTIVENLNASLSNPDKLTMGDVVILQSITNLLNVAAKDVVTLLGLTNGGSDSSDPMETVKKLLNESETAIKQTLTILNSAANSSSIFKGAGLSEIIDSFMNTENK